MKFAGFLGCKIPYYLNHYGTSTKAVLSKLGIELEEIEFSCCGYPTRHLDTESYIFTAARNLALAEARDLDILTPCKCCFGSLQHACHWLIQDEQLAQKINARLADEGVRWQGKTRVKHLLTVLAQEIGLDTLASKVTRPFNNLKIAAHYGCHALRPSSITDFDDPVAPSLFEKLIAVTGATSIEWDKRLECCGNPLWEKNSALSIGLMNNKLQNARQSGADYLCVACTYCQIQFDTVQHDQLAQNGQEPQLASILYPQLLGLSMGLDEQSLGLHCNKLDITQVGKFMS